MFLPKVIYFFKDDPEAKIKQNNTHKIKAQVTFSGNTSHYTQAFLAVASKSIFPVQKSAQVAKYLLLDGLNSRNLIAHSFGTWKSEI